MTNLQKCMIKVLILVIFNQQTQIHMLMNDIYNNAGESNQKILINSVKNNGQF